MRSLALIVTLLSGVLVSSHPRNACNPLETLMCTGPKIMEMFNQHKEMMEEADYPPTWLTDEIKGCMDFYYPKELFEISHQCLVKNVPSLIIKSMMKQQCPDKSDMMKFNTMVGNCKLNKFGLLNKDMVLDVKVLESHMKEVQITGDDSQIVKDMWADCFVEQNEIDPPTTMMDNVKYMFILERCFSKKMMDKCEEKITYMYPIYYALTTINEPGKCRDVDPARADVEGKMKKCITNSSITLQSIQGPGMSLWGRVMSTFMGLISSFSSRNDMDLGEKLKKVKDALMTFKPDVKAVLMENCANVTRCFAKSMGVLSNNLLDTDEYFRIFSAFDGWDQEILNPMVANMKSCASKFGYSGKVDVTTNEQLHKMSEVCIKCKLPALADSCGLDNPITQFFFPFANKNIVEHFIMTMKDTIKNLVPPGVMTCKS